MERIRIDKIIGNFRKKLKVCITAEGEVLNTYLSEEIITVYLLKTVLMSFEWFMFSEKSTLLYIFCYIS